MNNIISNKLSKDSKSLLNSLFDSRIIALETSKDKIPTFSKQLQLKKLRDEVELFIEKRPNSEFEIRVLDKQAEDNEDYRLAVIMRNYKSKDMDKKPNRFIISIDNSFDSASYYEWALNNVLIQL